MRRTMQVFGRHGQHVSCAGWQARSDSEGRDLERSPFAATPAASFVLGIVPRIETIA